MVDTASGVGTLVSMIKKGKGFCHITNNWPEFSPITYLHYGKGIVLSVQAGWAGAESISEQLRSDVLVLSERWSYDATRALIMDAQARIKDYEAELYLQERKKLYIIKASYQNEAELDIQERKKLCITIMSTLNKLMAELEAKAARDAREAQEIL